MATRVEAMWGVRLREDHRSWHGFQTWVEQAKRQFSLPDQTEAVFRLRVGKKVRSLTVTRATSSRA